MSEKKVDEAQEIENGQPGDTAGGGDAAAANAPAGAQDAGGAEAGTGGESGGGETAAPAASQPAALKGITTDDQPRYLAEIVANHGLAKAAALIAQETGARSGKILIVDDLNVALNDLHYLDIKKKLATLRELVKNEAAACAHFAEAAGPAAPSPEEKADQEKTELEIKIDELLASPLFLFSPAAIIPFVTGVGAVATATAASLKAIGDVLSYFRSEYDIKGQTLAGVDDLYVNSLVTHELLKGGNTVQLLNFNHISSSDLLSGLNRLVKDHLQLLVCLEKLRPEGLKATVDTLYAYLKELRGKHSEYVVKIDTQALAELQDAIAGTEAALETHYKERVSSAEIDALQAHLAKLREKLVEALAADTSAAAAALQAEIDGVTEKLAQGGLKQAKIDELAAYRQGLIVEKAKAVVSGSGDTVSGLRAEIEKSEQALAAIRRTRVPDSQIAAEEAHLASLRAKVVALMAINDDDAEAALRLKISQVEKEIIKLQEEIGEAERMVNRGKKITDAVDTFIANITTTVAGDAHPPLINACVREYVLDDGSQVKFLLLVNLSSAGAEVITEKKSGFWNTPDLAYLGGGVISFILADTSGSIVAANTVGGISQLDHKLGRIKRPITFDLK